MEGEKRIVCVTGGAGFLASWLIMRLLKHGYFVRTTTRSNPEYREETTHLTSLPGASERLEIFEADLNAPNSFTSAIKGCMGVFHVAHPTITDPQEPIESVIKTCVEGTLGILQACVDSETVKRVVYTSSVAAVLFNKTAGYTGTADESSWTDIDFCGEMKIPATTYFIAKTATERAALLFAEENGLDLVTVLPSVVVGPFLIPNFPFSFSAALAPITGDAEQCKLLRNAMFVHIDDAVSAHIFLFENPEAKGRYICSSNSCSARELAHFLSSRYPQYQISQCLVSGMEDEKPVQVYSRRLLDLGFKFKYGLEEMFDGALRCCKEKGFLVNSSIRD
ncbi:noscapine synthase SDR1-like [Aristolochia californica]|uniref:noscapine synthase SDR1-like n=1 Tax=Aristolochia californica TaxID=171875 RepID=UPI0035DC27F6